MLARWNQDDILWATNQTSDNTGVWTGTTKLPGLVYSVLPRTAGDYVNSINISGNNITVTFKKLKGPLGLTIGTLLTATIFEDVTGVVNFDLIGSKPVL